MAAAKARGVELGKNGKVMAAKNRAAADEHALAIAPAVRALQSDFPTIRGLMAAMNAEGVPTAKGGTWHVPSVHRLVKRLDRLGA